MKNVKTCPSCGRHQECKNSRYCTCGYDTGQDAQFVPTVPRVQGNPHLPKGRISARATFFQKRVFPLLYLVMVGALFLDSRRTHGVEWPLSLFQTSVALAILFAIIRIITPSYVDEVFDNGDKLIIRNAGREESISFKDIEEVKVDIFQPAGINIHLKRDSMFGRSIKFLPAVGLLRCSKIAKSLRSRLDVSGEEEGAN